MSQRVYLAVSVFLGLSGVLLLFGGPAVDGWWIGYGEHVRGAEVTRMVGGLLFGVGLLGLSRAGAGPAEKAGAVRTRGDRV